MATAAELHRQAEQAREIADELAKEATAAARAELEASRPKMPAVAEGATVIVAFARYQSGRNYDYAAVGWRDGRSVRWAVTGQEGRRFNWPGLLAWVGEANWPSLRIMTTGSYLITEGSEPAVAETMGRYGRVLHTETISDDSVAAGVLRHAEAYGPW